MVFDPTSEALDYIILAGSKSPGLAVVSGGDSPRKWDEMQSVGATGASSKWTGDGLAKCDVELLMWLPEHFAAWETFKLLVKKTPKGVVPKAMQIQHPFLDDLEITSVVLVDRTQLTLKDEKGIWSVVLHFKQYKKPEPALGKPSGAIDKPPPAQDDFLGAYGPMIQANSAKIAALQTENAKTP